jgi:hypothetical protein
MQDGADRELLLKLDVEIINHIAVSSRG